MRSTRPSAPTTTVMRFAYFASSVVAAPYAFEIDLSASERIENGNENFSMKCLFASGLSNETPSTTTLAFAYSWLRSRKPHPSFVQPGVSAFGKNHSTRRLPRNSSSVRSLPFWSFARNDGAGAPTVAGVGMGVSFSRAGDDDESRAPPDGLEPASGPASRPHDASASASAAGRHV